jgi:hypothetical protein
VLRTCCCFQKDPQVRSVLGTSIGRLRFLSLELFAELGVKVLTDEERQEDIVPHKNLKNNSSSML